MINKLTILITFLNLLLCTTLLSGQEKPNILLIIADEVGVDALNAYEIGTVLPNTPNIDKLRETGVTFENAWACPACSPTRASLLTGEYGATSGVNTIPGILKPDKKTIFDEVTELTDSAYAISVIGKWHNSKSESINHPYWLGADDFMGVVAEGVDDYFRWDKVENRESTICTEYATSYFTNYAIDWIKQQNKPWFMWFAHTAAHIPLHVPPTEMYTSDSVETNLQKFIAMIESMDYEIGRLLDSIPANVLANTVVLFIGDNGTPSQLLQGFQLPNGKNTVYQGGVHVPMVVAGKGVSRVNEREKAMVNVSDFYATIAQLVAPNAYPNNKVNDSYSFKHLLSDTIGEKRTYNYMELGANQWAPSDVYTIRNTQYKIIYDADGKREMFDLLTDPFEANNLLNTDLNNELLAVKYDLEQQMFEINGILFDSEEPIDTSTSTIDISNKELIIYPNPAINFVTVSNDRTIKKIALHNLQGEKVLEQVTNSETIQLNISELKKGLYLIFVENELNVNLTQKLIVK